MLNKALLLLAVFISMSYLGTSTSHSLSSSAISVTRYDQKIRTLFHSIYEDALYFGAGTALGSAYLLTRLGWEICRISPWASTAGNECLLLSHVCGIAARHAFARTFNGSSSSLSLFRGIPPSHNSWYVNQAFLSQIPAVNQEQKQLLHFLERRWLAKSTGTYSLLIDWICPCFGISIQVHPETTNSYARDPANKFSQTYLNRVEDWKQSLPHPSYFPLILTRPAALQDYLPSYLSLNADESIRATALKIKTTKTKVVVDLTQILSVDTKDRKAWLQLWETYREQFSSACKELDLDLTQIICIHQMQQEEIGGIRLLPWSGSSTDQIEKDYLFLLEWISKFGLSANRIELDRWPVPYNSQNLLDITTELHIDFLDKDDFVSYLNAFDIEAKSNHPQKALMLRGTIQTLKGLFAHLSENKWNEIIRCPTRSSLTRLAFSRMKERFELLAKEDEQSSFFDTASHIELIHADLSSLIEIFSPFSSEDFPKIYRDLLTSIPAKLQPFASFGIHSSGMTSLTGIIKAVERTAGKPPRVLYGENTYFEIIHAAEMVSNASAIDEATEKDWEEVDLLLVQFNPVLKRIDFLVTEYKAENIAEVLHKSLTEKREKPLTLALDCTLDYLNSSRVYDLFQEFEEQIEKGNLNIVCYRSGLKFDLFGMDNYCGAPFYMLHNADPKWNFFNALSHDAVLQTDRLSLNWFCLAYQYAAPELELYRKQVFDNTRAFLNKIPDRLLNAEGTHYRIIPVREGADPAFIDIKIYGTFHEFKGGMIGGFLSIKCMEAKLPVFYRPSLGFYHTNFSVMFAQDCTTIRLTLGLDPSQVDLLVNCFEIIDSLNGAPPQVLLDKLQQPLRPDLKEALPAF